jgi:hypothetical protein
MVEGLARRSTIALIGFAAAAGATQAVAQESAEQLGSSSVSGAALPLHNIWVTYTGYGSNSENNPPGDTWHVSVADMRWPIFSLRTPDVGISPALEADITTPAGYDDRHLRADDIWQSESSSDPFSRAAERKQQLETALNHHRPMLRLVLDGRGGTHLRPSTEYRRHHTCARRLVRGAIEEQVRTAENEVQRRSRGEHLEGDYISNRLTPPIDRAALLLRLATLRLPNAEDTRTPFEWLGNRRLEESAQPGTQLHWVAEQVRDYGRPVTLALDLRSAVNSPAARLCRTLRYSRLRNVRTDSCRVEGVIDRRDGWPMTIMIVREGVAGNRATEMQFRRFNRVAPLQGFVSPPNPCAASPS